MQGLSILIWTWRGHGWFLALVSQVWFQGPVCKKVKVTRWIGRYVPT